MDKRASASSAPIPTGLLVYAGPTAQREPQVNELLLGLALVSPVWVMDCGNRFNPLRLTRAIRLLGGSFSGVLESIHVARAFTCYQAAALVQQPGLRPGPLFLLDVLFAFSDESVPLRVRARLLGDTLNHLQGHAAARLVVVSTPALAGLPDFQQDWLVQLHRLAGLPVPVGQPGTPRRR